MTEKTEKKGILSRLFGKKEGSCCNFNIEEISEEENQSQTQDQTDSPDKGGSCCGSTQVSDDQTVN